MDGPLEPDALEQRVLTFTSIRAGVDLRKITPMTQLARDLHIRGDGASKYFDAFAKEFRVNLDELNMHWDSHFRPEPGVILNTIFWIVGVLAMLAALRHPFFLWYWVSTNEWWAVCTVAVVGGVFAAWFQQRRRVPVTVADLIDAAEAGRWVKRYKTSGAG